ncbi:MAG TPA: response regulator [Methylomirabilota bacterium]|jgi:DNA-binding response OmpR family regulator
MSPAGATILVVDDEPTVLETVRDGLTAHGYQVLTAGSGEEALQVAQAHQGVIALALVDVVMPAMGGPDVAQRLHQARPDLKVLFMSGFSTEVVVVHGITAGDPLLVKPFSLESLARKVHELVDYRSPFSRPPQPPR